ncbi:MAG: alpha/beta hydrolase [Acidocella sp.]|nr:alpha/beta hydrolase [Acidocella sp.]
MSHPICRIRAGMLDVAYEDYGAPSSTVVILLHGFPYDPRCYDEVAPLLVSAGYRVIVPYLRGYGQTRFIDEHAMRSGQQAAMGYDVVALMDALAIPDATLMGFDWGGRGACVVAALWPERVRALVTALGYAIQDIAAAVKPLAPETEHLLWYQYYFHTQRGRAGLAANRAALSRFLWRLWSPSWAFDEATFQRTADSFDNPDFVEVVVHSYQHRFGYAPGDPTLEAIEKALAARPQISVPTIALYGADDGVMPLQNAAADDDMFTNHHERRVLAGVGHNIPQEAPHEVVKAILDLMVR